MAYLRQVFQMLKENKLYVKKKKCAFVQSKIAFLGHIMGGGTIRMDQGKVRSILDWSPPTKVLKLQSFLGLTNYHRRFIHGYSHIVLPLTNMLKKDISWDWNEKSKAAFEDLKWAITKEPVLALPDHSKPYEIHTNVSDFAIEGSLCR